MGEFDLSREPVIRTRSLEKSYGDVRAVRGIDLDVRRGEVYGFLGRNGAGKTTTIRMILGLVRPTGGEIWVFGKPLGRARLDVAKDIGFLVEAASAYPNLTVRENLEIQRRLTDSRRGSVDEAIELLGLGEYRDRRAGRLSLGNKQRLSLARAMIAKAPLLILDEPANGLDPAGIREIRDLLRALADERGTTIFMSSHILAEVDRLADRIGIIHDGLLVEELDRDSLERKRRKRIQVEVDDAEKALRILRGELGLSHLESIKDGAIGISDEGAEPGRIARALVGAGLSLTRLATEGEDLEEHFLRLTGGGTWAS